jgi:flagellar hook-basal body complex protein FliE
MSPIDALRGAGALSGASGIAGPGGLASSGATAATGFADIMKAALDQTSRAQATSASLQSRFLMEDPTVGLEEAVIAMQKASIGFQAVVQARNKLVSAYSEIMNMSV